MVALTLALTLLDRRDASQAIKVRNASLVYYNASLYSIYDGRLRDMGTHAQPVSKLQPFR